MNPTHPNPRETFQALLRELFQIEDAAELDFGIYRIMGQKRGVIEKFIDQELLDVIEAELHTGALKKESSASARLDDLATQIQETLDDEAIDPEGNLAEAYAQTKLGKEYRAVQKAAHGSRSLAEQESTIYNHLYDFFKRYYDKGDFMSQRRYSKREKYAIPYNGEETHFHWSNADQYYIKTGESFTDYRWKDPSGAVRVKFSVTSANVPKDNIKAPEKRFFIPQIKDLTVETSGTAKNKDRYILLTLPFHYRGLTEAETKHYETLADEHGLKNGNGNGGRLQAAILVETVETLPKSSVVKASPEMIAALGAEHHTSAEGEPVARLAHHLRRFTVKNTSDYFIHKDLEGFLTRELDFYLKNEVLHLDNLEAGGEQRAEGWFEVMRVIRRIGSQIIDFLAQIENFQKRLFEKKKFVTECHYCLTLDRVPEALYPEIAKNEKQIQEWKALYAIEEVKGWSEPPTAAFLKDNSNLVVDTGNFSDDQELRDRILESVDNLEPNDCGLAVNSENFQALSLLENRFRESSKCVYIDPPYNTSSSEILYKNSFKHSSWGTMMLDRLVKLKSMMSNDGAIFVSIDGHERTVLEHVMHSVFGADNHIEDLIWAMNTTNSQLPNYSTNHEYVIVHSKDRSAVENDKQMFREPKPGWEDVMELVEKLNPDYPPVEEIEAALKALYEQHIKEYREQIESLGFEWKEEKKNDPWKGIYNYSHAEYRDSDGVSVEDAEVRKKAAQIWIWREADMSMPATKQADSTRDADHPNWRFYRPKHPSTGKPVPHPKSGWKFPYEHLDEEEKRSFVSLDKYKRIAWGQDETKVPQIKRMLHEVETNIAKSVFADFSDGEKQTSALFGQSGLFLAPKHASFVSRFILQATRADSVVIDCFGGSGSSAHAVLDTNRLDEGERSFVTVEMGNHFDSLIIPRLKKVVYSADWKSGKPTTRDSGISHCFKYLRLESYEDALGNIAFNENEVAQRQLDFDQYVIHYMLDCETRGSETLLSTEKLVAPFDYKLEIREGDELRVKPVDLPETFNFLIGLRVRTRRVYWREVERGRKTEKYLVLRGRTNPHATGGEREVVVIWRTTEGWKQEDYIADRAFIESELELTKDADEVFTNDDSLLRHPNVKSLDPVFKRRMFNQAN